ncbi:hypothetical protein HJC10_30580 [Corallococcus exiguus]|uniref:hypothetical protein n=1 Tax=Corallococcus exiguus TaxID=83462 RepID=UPI001471BB79|nr:hypothetical protein [Corallococcus exiguus]NNB87400.1 hypothetical protein [Corallococcus exiguus]NNB97759.1 hypothetical protein [Corallococcus exiguus]NNC07183.1 hypothetical protein [Corallococcus exiguus]
MVAIKIVKPFLRSGEPFPIQVMRMARGNVTISFKVANKVRHFGVDDSAAQPKVTLAIAGGAPRNFLVTGWGAASTGSIVTLTVNTDEGETDFDSATVGP